ncbi:unnamed protein product [Pylaiella littoralis]
MGVPRDSSRFHAATTLFYFLSDTFRMQSHAVTVMGDVLGPADDVARQLLLARKWGPHSPGAWAKLFWLLPLHLRL